MEEKSWLEKGLEFWDKEDYERAFECFREGDKEGDAECTEYLGLCYNWGHGAEMDLHKAAFYNEKAAKAGVPSAMYDTGLNYERGQGVQQDINKAIDWLEKSAAAGYATACLELGNIFCCGLYGIEKDLNKSLEYYRQGAELGGNRSKTALADFYIEGKLVEKDTEKARQLYQEAFDSMHEKAVFDDDVTAQFWLGTIYSEGLPILNMPIDYNQAAEWYLKAANNHFDDAQNNLGIMYTHGMGVAQDYKKAFEWFMKAAERQNDTAMSNVANCYYNGKGVAQDYIKAAEYHSKAAHLGYANSQEVLGEMYLKGLGVEENYTNGAYWLKLACENGERSAYAPMGNCYLNGWGVDKDEKKAFVLYQKGAEKGDLLSKVNMAECLIEGWGTKSDLNRATEILEVVCNEEEGYRKNLVSVTSHDDEKMVTFYSNPLDEMNLEHYARAYYLLGKLYYVTRGKGGASAAKAIVMLKTAEKLGYKGDEMPPEVLIEKIVSESKRAEVQDAVDCYVEVRELTPEEIEERNSGLGKGQKQKHEIFDVVLHHADETESVVVFRGRDQFLYILALMIAYKGKKAASLRTAHFAYMRETLAKLAEESCVDTNGTKEWIDQFIYAEQKLTGEVLLDSARYSNARSAANRAISELCNDDEYEVFQIKSTRGRNAIATMALSPKQIVLPKKLRNYLYELPSEAQIATCSPHQYYSAYLKTVSYTPC